MSKEKQPIVSVILEEKKCSRPFRFKLKRSSQEKHFYFQKKFRNAFYFSWRYTFSPEDCLNFYTKEIKYAYLIYRALARKRKIRVKNV